MISSQEGTEDRRPRAVFRLWRVACSPVASAGAGAADWTGSAGGAGGTAGTAGVAAAAGGTVAESPPADGDGVRWRASATRESSAARESWPAARAARAGLPRPAAVPGPAAPASPRRPERLPGPGWPGERSVPAARWQPEPRARGARSLAAGSLPTRRPWARGRRPRRAGPLIPGPPAIAETVTQAVAHRAVAVPGARHRGVARSARAKSGRVAQPRCQVRHGRLARRRGGRRGGFAAGSDIRAALSSAGSTCLRRGSKIHSAACSRPPVMNVSWTSQLPSPRLLGVPLRVFRFGAGSLHPFGHYLAQPRTGVASPDVVPTPAGPDRTCRRARPGPDLEPAHALDRDAGRVRDFLDRFPGADSCLDLLGSQGTLHFDLVLREPGGLAEGNRPEPLVDRQREACAAPGHSENSVSGRPRSPRRSAVPASSSLPLRPVRVPVLLPSGVVLSRHFPGVL